MTYALITGASKGIGKAIAVELAQRGYNVLLIARSEGLLNALAKDLSAQYKIQTDYLAIDLSAHTAAEDVYQWCLQKNYNIDILVNNAGYGLSGQFEKYSVNDNLDMMQVNMVTLVHLCQLFLPMLRRQSKSYILNIASSAAYQAVPYLNLYSATKVFVLHFSRGLRQELRNSPVSVTCISPGPTDTDFPRRAELGKRGLETAQKFNMTPEAVAKISVKAMLARKTEVIIGVINKLSAFASWLLPKGMIEKTAMKIYQ